MTMSLTHTYNINDFGLPQRSILVALLFIIYINDMPDVPDKCEDVLHADDTHIYTGGTTSEEHKDIRIGYRMLLMI